MHVEEDTQPSTEKGYESVPAQEIVEFKFQPSSSVSDLVEDMGSDLAWGVLDMEDFNLSRIYRIPNLVKKH